MKNLFYILVQWPILLAIEIPLLLMGIFIIPLALPFRVIHKDTCIPFRDYPDRYWCWVSLPKWAWIWSNDRDGALGDRRGWWHNHTGGARKFWSMYRWLAARNPVNNMRFVPGLACHVTECIIIPLLGIKNRDVNDRIGETGFQLLKAIGPKFNYYSLYYVRPNKNNPTKAFVIRMGHKFKLSHNTTDWTRLDSNVSWKSFTFKINFNKDIS